MDSPATGPASAGSDGETHKQNLVGIWGSVVSDSSWRNTQTKPVVYLAEDDVFY